MNRILVPLILLASILTSQHYSNAYAAVPSSYKFNSSDNPLYWRNYTLSDDVTFCDPDVETCPLDVRYDVELVPQTTGYSCWAAGAAMLVGWRDGIPVDPYEIANSIGYWKQYKESLAPNDVEMFKHWGLMWEYPADYDVEGFADLLWEYGPLWVASAEPGPHIRVVTGMVGDGTPNGTIVLINDPWERGMNEFRMPNHGSQYNETYFEFVQKQDELGYREKGIQGAIYVAHLPFRAHSPHGVMVLDW